MSQIVTAHWEQDGGDVYIPFGFVPDYLFMIDNGTGNDAQIRYYWFKMSEDDAASGYQDGYAIAADGTMTDMASAAGIDAYDGEAASPTISKWAASTTFTARTATAPGTYVRPLTAAKGDKSAIFECVDSGTTGSTEPSWDTDCPGIGDQVTDNDGVWERVNVPQMRKGYKGVCVADNIQTNGYEMWALAIEADNNLDLGDVDGWTDGIYPGTVAF